MLTPLHRIPIEADGELAVMARPRGGEWLADEVANWASLGVNQVVSALTEPEIVELGIAEEEALCSEAGIRYRTFPIVDRSVPESAVAFLDLIEDVSRGVAAGQFVAIHCRMGIGRAGLLAAAVLGRTGVLADDAFDRISAARGLSVPDTPEQVAWLRNLAI